MQLTPRYGSTPLIALDGDAGAIAEPLIRQRRRFAEIIAGLTDEQWSHASRCEGWSVQDVAVHLGSTNAFWEASIRSGLAGSPTEMLATFDPVATPARMVADSALSTDQIIDTFATSTESLAGLLLGLAGDDWDAIGEAPPGHVSISAVAHHALWDSWIHERDVLVPLGRRPEVVPDEVVSSLRYVAGFTPALALAAGATGVAGFDVSATDPDASFHVAIGADVFVSSLPSGSDFELVGSSVELLEALSFRSPLDQEIPSTLDWAFAGLGAVFDR